jgi:glucose 1-dehydrogenase
VTRLLDGKVAVITGASSGLGRAMAINFAAEGAAMVIGDVREDTLEGGEGTVQLIPRSGGNALFVRTDVAIWKDIDALISTAVYWHGRLDVMVNNAEIASGTGLVSPHDTPYGVSKAGAIHLTRQIAVAFAQQLIVCNCISPGKIVIERPNFPPDPEIENARWRTPWPRPGRPQDIANAAVFLASDRATYMTGSNLVVDGAG